MEKALYNVVYNRKKRLLPDGTALVQVEAYLRGRKKYFSTKIYLTPDQWDKKHRRVRNHPNAGKLNRQITDFITQLETIELDRLNSGQSFTLDNLTDALNGKVTTNFLQFMEAEIEAATTSPRTKANHRATLRALKRFRAEILFTEVNFDFPTSFERHLYGKELGINTINKYFRHIKRYVNLAIDKELFDLNRYPFRKFKPKSETAHREYLTPEELEAIEGLTFPSDKQHLNKIRDMFLFSCYTGLRFSDLSALSKDNLVTEGGHLWIEIRMQKTNEPIRIPVYLLFDGRGVEILNRYTLPDRKYIFDELTNQYVNRGLKEISQLTGITKRVTFHVSRHTQANYLLYKGVSITTVQKLLGHKRIQTTQIYGKVMDTTIVSELESISFAK